MLNFFIRLFRPNVSAIVADLHKMIDSLEAHRAKAMAKIERNNQKVIALEEKVRKAIDDLDLDSDNTENEAVKAAAVADRIRAIVS